MLCSGNTNNVFGAPDSMISANQPYLHISNFSNTPITIAARQVLGIARNPCNWLDQKNALSETDIIQIETHANLIQQLSESPPPRSNPVIAVSDIIRSQTEVTSKAQRNAMEKDDPLAEEPIEGGPKTASTPEDDIESSKLIEAIDILPNLTENQKAQLVALITKHVSAFGLDGKLGNYPGKVEVMMKEGTVPISLLPYHASLANRDVIDKQMDAWIELGVIEPSKSPWATPVFIVYHNNKPRMVINL